MRTYIAHNMDGNEELLADLETARSKVVAARKLAEEDVCLLRKDDEENEVSQAEACQLDEEKMAMSTKNEKSKEKTAWLSQKLQDLRARFVDRKEDLEADYQKQVDDMFFYGYRCCMKKHDIANNTPSFSFDDEDDEFLGGPAQGDEPALGDGHALGGSPSTEDNSRGERTWLLFHFFFYFILVGCGLDFHICKYNVCSFEFFSSI